MQHKRRNILLSVPFLLGVTPSGGDSKSLADTRRSDGLRVLELGIASRSLMGSTPLQEIRPGGNDRFRFLLSTPLPFASVPTTEPNGVKLRRAVIHFAARAIGTPYLFGSDDPAKGLDCSGFTRFAYKKGAEISLARSARDQYVSAKRQYTREDVVSGKLLPADLVFFYPGPRTGPSDPTRISHVALLCEEGVMVNARRAGKPASFIGEVEEKTHWQKSIAFGASYILD